MRWLRRGSKPPVAPDQANRLDAELDALMRGAPSHEASAELAGLLDVAGVLVVDAQAVPVPPAGERRRTFLAGAPKALSIGRRRHLAARAALVAATLVVATGGIAGASIPSKPGDLLYPVHRAVNRVVWLVTGSPAEKADGYLGEAEVSADRATLARTQGRGDDAAALVREAEEKLRRAREEIARLDPADAEPLLARAETLSGLLAPSDAGSQQGPGTQGSPQQSPTQQSSGQQSPSEQPQSPSPNQGQSPGGQQGTTTNGGSGPGTPQSTQSPGAGKGG